MNKRLEKQLAFMFGVVFIIALIVSVFLIPNPTPFQYIVLRIVLALAAAGVAGTFSGFLEITLPGWLKAGGAAAVFVIVFFYNPASLEGSSGGTRHDSPPMATPTPIREVEHDPISDEDARFEVNNALHRDDIHQAVMLLHRLNKGSVKEEECAHIFDYAMKHERLEDARNIVNLCWEGTDKRQKLIDISHVSAKQQ